MAHEEREMRINFFWVSCIVAAHFLPMPFVEAQVVGSNTTVSRQPAFTLLGTQTDNAIIGFTKTENGFALQDQFTSVEWDALFPTSGTVNLCGGEVFLDRDFVVSDTALFATFGSFIANNEPAHLELSHGTSILQGYVTLSNDFLVSPTNRQFYWGAAFSYDTKYLYVFDQSTRVLNWVYLYDGNSFTVTAFAQPLTGANVQARSVTTHPSLDYIVVGRNTGHLDVVYHNRSNGTFTLTQALLTPGASGTSAITLPPAVTGRVSTVSFDPKGQYVAVARATGAGGELLVYSFNPNIAAKLSFTASVTLSPARTAVQASWHPTSSYVALATAATNSQCLIYNFTGTALTLAASLGFLPILNYQGTGVTFDTTGSYLLFGKTINVFFNGNSLLKFDPTLSSLTEIGSSDQTGNARLFAHPRGRLFATTRDVTLPADTFVHFFDDVDEAYFVNEGTTFKYDTYSDYWGAEFSRDGKFRVNNVLRFQVLGAIVPRSTVSVKRMDTESYGSGHLVKNCSVLLSGNVSVNTPLTFAGQSAIVGKGMQSIVFTASRDFLTHPAFYVAENSSLLLKNLTLYIDDPYRLYCFDDNATISFDNVKIVVSGLMALNKGKVDVLSSCLCTGQGVITNKMILPVTISSGASFFIDSGITYSIAPREASVSPFVFTDSSSMLFLNGCSLISTQTGFSLTKGTIVVDGKVTFSNSATVPAQGVSLGDGTAPNRPILLMRPDASIEIVSGILTSAD